jgi:hypothetical protein
MTTSRPTEVDPVARRQQQRVAGDLAGQLAKGDHRAGEGHGTDQDADVDLDFVDGLLGAAHLRRSGRVDVVGETDQHRREADHAVHQRDQFRHLRHLHGAGRIDADGTDHHRGDDPRVTGTADTRTEDRRQNGDGHADDAVEIAAARGLGLLRPPRQRMKRMVAPI